MSVNVYFCLMNLAHVMCVVILFSLLLYDSASIVGRTLACGSHKDISVNVLNRSGKFCLCIFHPICELVTHGTQQTHTEHTESEVPWSSGQPAVVAFGKPHSSHTPVRSLVRCSRAPHLWIWTKKSDVQSLQLPTFFPLLRNQTSYPLVTNHFGSSSLSQELL